MIAAHPVPQLYRQPLIGQLDPQLRKSLITAGSLGLVFMIVVLITPRPAPDVMRVEELPERFAKLILDEPAPPTPAPVTAAPGAEAPVPTEVEPEPKPIETPRPKITPRQVDRRPQAQIAPNRGTAGRAKAKAEVTEQLAAVSTDISKTIQSLASVLPTVSKDNSSSKPTARRGGRGLRSGRAVARNGNTTQRNTTQRNTSSATNLGSGGLSSGAIDLGDLGSFDLAGVDGDASAGGSSGGSGVTGSGTGERSASSLMAIVRRYAPGIRYCYDTALESNRSLRGKLVFRITVAANGRVAGVEIVEDSLHSSSVRSCALAQIDAWRFGSASSASVFNAPFVFRPNE